MKDETEQFCDYEVETRVTIGFEIEVRELLKP